MATGFSELPKLKNQTVGVNAYYRLSPYSKLNLEYHHMEEFRRGGNRFDLPPHIAEDANLNGSANPDWWSRSNILSIRAD